MESRGVLTRARLLKLVIIMACGALLTACDKCGDYFFINGAAPHSCKEAPADR